MESNRVSPEGLAEFDQFLDIAEHAGIYVHPTGPGQPDWAKGDRFADDALLAATENFWKQFAARYRDRKVIFAYDLLNEPMIQWDSPALREKWNRWLQQKYSDTNALVKAWNATNENFTFGSIPVPAAKDCPGCARLLDYQHFRESIADDWTRRQVSAIKSVAPETLVTIGLIQWSVPCVLPANSHYSGFRSERQAPLLDFLTIHFYPLAAGHYDYKDANDEAQNLAYLNCVARAISGFHKPAVIGEFGWYGGGKLNYGNHPFITEAQQARWCRKAVDSTAGVACGWLNWGFYDQPEATDVSRLTGLVTANGAVKAWGREFRRLSKHYQHTKFASPKAGQVPALDWDLCITTSAARAAFDKENLAAWQAAHGMIK